MKPLLLAVIALVAACADPTLDIDVASRSVEVSVGTPTTRPNFMVTSVREPPVWPLDLTGLPGGNIVGGTFHVGNPEVPLIAMLDADRNIIGICSGTLIEPDLVLTAAHCVDGEVPAVGYDLYFGTDLLGADPFFEFETSAESVVFHPAWNPDDLLAGNDIALIHLVEDVPIPPARIRTTPLSQADVGSPLHLVGWGITGGGLDDSGIKRHVVSALAGFDAKLVSVGNSETNTCSGDSGGPAFLELDGVEQVVGVTSFGDVDCLETGFSTRVDTFVDFIDANREPGTGAGGGLGAPCQEGDTCQSGVCVTGDAPGFCSQRCSAAAPCPNNFECVGVDAQNAVCVPAAQVGGGQLGDFCEFGDDCVSGLCATADDGSGICTAECETSFDCGVGFECEIIQGISVCLPGDGDSDGGGFPTPIVEEEGGCSAAGPGGSGARAALAALLPLMMAAALRRRRRSVQRARAAVR